MQNPALVDITPPDVKKSTFITLLLSPLVYVLWFMAKTISAVADMLEGNTSRRLRGEIGRSPLTFRHEMDAIILQQSALFVSLLTDIRSHLLLSKSTRSVYISVAERTLRAKVQGFLTKPTDRDFYDYVFYHWPTFSSFKAPTSGGIMWGRVEKGPFEPNEVDILSSIVESAESAATACNPHRLPLDLLKFIIATVILRELSHAFVKFYFNKIATPLGVGTTEESGWSVEEEFMDGQLAAEWIEKSKFGEMDAINWVVLINGPKSWVVDVDTATKVISSLRGPTLYCPVTSTLTPHVETSGSVRARIAEFTENPVPTTKMASIGNNGPLLPRSVLSFIGYDRPPVSHS